MSPEAPGRLMLLVEAASNRRLLARAFEQHYRLVDPADLTWQCDDVDLIIADPKGLARWQSRVGEARRAQSPTLLPVILLLTRAELRRPLTRFRDLIDEFAVLPLDRLELTTRLHLWMRARRLALRQRDELAHLVNHDRLTGLATRPLICEHLRQALAVASEADQRVCFQIIEVADGTLLTSLGHSGHRQALVSLSGRLSALLDASTRLARLGDAQWGLLHPPGRPVDQVLDLAHATRRRMLDPLEIDGERLHLSPRMSVAVAPDDAREAEALIDRAQQALSAAGDGAPAFFSPDMQAKATTFLRMEAELRRALDDGGLVLWLQPKVSLDGLGLTEAAEALVRLQCPDGKLLPPGAFIGVAETTGLIRELSRWVVEEACRLLARWRDAGTGLPRLAVNVSAHDLEEDDFADALLAALARHSLPGNALELELTETTLFAMTDRGLATLTRLRERGMRIAMDDFGTGYSTLSYLHRLPIDVLKIDRAFVQEVHAHPDRAGITRAIISLATTLGLELVAEGIEAEAEAAFLADLGVAIGQGYLYARPMPEAELMAWLDATRPRSMTGAS
ncbi:putative bifunctional diguanylate cyclase/phosphodiesterase [Halomonas koreensis]|uniref:GGDEF domain-containing phosphodiesterase n=1 Tax=Halomonas koreensis TaxID=245385 RepID=A0ABU1FZZ8_9GAMM|nr:GGDEF domain-containing phosphodiesterase [Halomonas koreensis]MDR5865797.1 GGDEF domain-containing phosphodiesterase [Halomonas koreensis]